jgi:hypothetical protein
VRNQVTSVFLPILPALGLHAGTLAPGACVASLGRPRLLADTDRGARARRPSSRAGRPGARGGLLGAQSRDRSDRVSRIILARRGDARCLYPAGGPEHGGFVSTCGRLPLAGGSRHMTGQSTTAANTSPIRAGSRYSSSSACGSAPGPAK